jgi:hypothetical protein
LADCGGEVPALRDPAKFNFSIITRITDGNRLDEPVWVRENTDPNMYEENTKSAILNVKSYTRTFLDICHVSSQSTKWHKCTTIKME